MGTYPNQDPPHPAQALPQGRNASRQHHPCESEGLKSKGFLMGDFHNRVAWIHGAAGTVGLACAHSLAETSR
jgi:hypothetical protein